MKSTYSQTNTALLTKVFNAKPTAPVVSKGLVVGERKVNDPSSCCDGIIRYPIPSFSSSRVRGTDS